MTDRKKVGLALGGGAARGLAHLGVLEVLEREHIPIDMIAGTSIGALVGAFYAHTQNLPRMKALALEIGTNRLRYFSDLTVPRTGLLRWNRIENRLKKDIGGVRFEDLRIPFACVASDLDNGREAILNTGSVWEAIRASATIPGLLSIPSLNQRHLVDGGILNPVPVDIVKRMGADFVIAVNVLPSVEGERHREINLFTVLIKSVYLFSYHIIESSLKQADIVIHPDTDPIGFVNFQRVNEAVLIGSLAAESAIPQIKARLGLI